MRQRRAADDRDRRRSSASSRASRSMRLRGDAGHLLDPRRARSRRGRPTSRRWPRRRVRAVGRAQLVGDDHVREAEREHAFGARLDRHPLVGVRAGQRHPRLDLHELAAHAWPPLPHRAVAGALRHRRVPGAEKIGAEAITKRDRARSIVGSCSWPKLIALARRSTSSPNSSNPIGAGAPKPIRNSAASACGGSAAGRVSNASDF